MPSVSDSNSTTTEEEDGQDEENIEKIILNSAEPGCGSTSYDLNQAITSLSNTDLGTGSGEQKWEKSKQKDKSSLLERMDGECFCSLKQSFSVCFYVSANFMKS